MKYISSLARDYARSRATGVMLYECRAERVQKANYDEDNLRATAGSRTTLYEGPCRVYESSGAMQLNLGDADVDIQSTRISLPWDAPLLKKNDEIMLTGAETDVALVGKRYQIQSSAKAGELRATRSYDVTAVN